MRDIDKGGLPSEGFLEKYAEARGLDPARVARALLEMAIDDEIDAREAAVTPVASLKPGSYSVSELMGHMNRELDARRRVGLPVFTEREAVRRELIRTTLPLLPPTPEEIEAERAKAHQWLVKQEADEEQELLKAEKAKKPTGLNRILDRASERFTDPMQALLLELDVFTDKEDSEREAGIRAIDLFVIALEASDKKYPRFSGGRKTLEVVETVLIEELAIYLTDYGGNAESEAKALAEQHLKEWGVLDELRAA